MKRSEITPMILTYNEEDNIERTLTQLQWAEEVVVIDAFSTDGTLDLLKKFPNVKVYQHAFESFAQQCNYGLTRIKTSWVLSMDADYVLTNELIQELKDINPVNANGFLIPFKYCVEGVPLRGTILPPRVSLYRKDLAQYHNDGHAHRVRVQGPIAELAGYIWHDDRKPLSRWLSSQDIYMKQEVEKLYSGVKLNFSDRIRKKIFLAPILVFFYCLFLKGGILDGKRGWYYAYQRMLAECLLALRLLDYRFKRRKKR